MNKNDIMFKIMVIRNYVSSYVPEITRLMGWLEIRPCIERKLEMVENGEWPEEKWHSVLREKLNEYDELRKCMFKEYGEVIA